jgi:hypothetical protein
MKSSTENRRRLLWLCSAAVVTVLRFFIPADPAYDLTFQLAAAQNLMAGNGLTIYQHSAEDLANPGHLVTVTSFASGYSLLAALLFALGLGVGSAIKVLGATATMLGWWGWGRIADLFFGEGSKGGSAWRWIGFTIAAFTPLLFTPIWGGTDIFLWAIVPWVLACFVSTSNGTLPARSRLDALAGALCGLALLMRYASLFLAVYAACVIVWQSRLRISVLARRWTAFGVGFLPLLAVQVYINYFLSEAAPIPGGLSLNGAQVATAWRLWNGVRLLYTATYSWVFWIPGEGLDLLVPQAAGALPWHLGITVIGLIVLLLVYRTYGLSPSTTSRDSRIAALGLFLAVPLMLMVSMMFGRYDYVGDRRYYLPLVPLSVLVAYSVASFGAPTRGSVDGWVRRSLALYLTGYVVMIGVYIVFLFLPGRIGSSQRQKLMGREPQGWLSMAVSSELSPARQLVMRLLKERPDSLLVTSTGDWFYWDAAVDQSKLHELNCETVQATYLSGSARIVLLTFDVGQPRELWYYRGNGIHGSLHRADCFERLPNLNVLQRFPAENMKVSEARVQAGERIILRP